MIKNVFVCALCIFLLYACNKSDANSCTTVIGQPTASEVTNLRNYLAANSIATTEDPKGFFYNIIFSGTGADTPSQTDSVTVRYKGTLTNGTVFDSTASGITRKFLLSDLITGWQYGLPLLKKGGVINLYLPPAHGYGCISSPNVPSNSVTVFHVELNDF